MAEYRIPLFDLVLTMAGAADLISPVVANHHKRVSYIVHRLTTQLGWADEKVQEAVIAAALHDLGAFSIEERVDLLEFELSQPQRHAELGYQFFRGFPPFAKIAQVIRFHHADWRDGGGMTARGHEVPEASFLLHLADRVDVLSSGVPNILSRTDAIVSRVQSAAGAKFRPEHVAAFSELAGLEYFWLDLRSPALDDILQRCVEVAHLEADADQIIELARLLSHLVDFKSQYTSTHTAGVAHTAAVLAELLGLEPARCRRVLLAGYLHDIGKLAVPREILDKPGHLDRSEYGMIKSHAYYTRRIVESFSGLEDVADWASSHHEHLDGKGYPFHLTDLPLESRVVAVADVFTALAEDRPYRPGFAPDEIRRILTNMVAIRKLDGHVVHTLLDHQEAVDRVREGAQRGARSDFAAMVERAHRLTRAPE